MSDRPNPSTEPGREAVYDAEISSHMREIIAICKRAQIPFYAAFWLDNDVVCTSQLLLAVDDISEEDREAYARFRRAFVQAARDTGAAPRVPLNLTVRDGSGNITRMETIL